MLLNQLLLIRSLVIVNYKAVIQVLRRGGIKCVLYV